MKTIKKEIQTQLDVLQEMINIGKIANEIEKQRKIVNRLLKEYLKDL